MPKPNYNTTSIRIGDASYTKLLVLKRRYERAEKRIVSIGEVIEKLLEKKS